MPHVRLKAAASLDGRTALPDGQSQWITGEAARADGHAWRARADAMLTGIGTVLHDDPRMDVRHGNPARQPDLAVVDSQLRTPPDARLFAARRRVYLYAAVADAGRQAALEAAGATVVLLPDGQGRVDLPALLRDLAARGVRSVHVEAGAALNGALLAAGLVDELLLYLAPRLIGQGLPLADIGLLPSLAQAVALEFGAVERVGTDLRVLARVGKSRP